MSWAFDFTPTAQQDLEGLPKAIQKRVARTIAQMAADPFHGNVKALQGEAWKGVFRRRIGNYRILFSANRSTETVTIHQISIRSEGTYR
jgi:mRNA-degrading endonuclease RelE of RelBE toxin-antitoxin system